MIKTLQYQNKKIHYRVTGKGNPVLLIHGFGEDGRVWDTMIDFLQDRFQLIVPDLPGSGQSELTADMSIEGMAEVIHTIIHEEDIDAYPVIGHSMGGYIALALIEKYPNHVSALGLFHSTAFADSEEKKEARRKSIRFIRENGPVPFLKTSIPNLFSPKSRDEMPGSIDQFIRDQHNFSGEALVKYYEAMIARPDRTAELQNSLVPVLFILGKYDAAVPLSDGLKQSHLPEKAYIHILQNSGHMGMMEENLYCQFALKEFLTIN